MPQLDKKLGNHSDTSRALATDLYQLTMGQGYYYAGIGERQSVFHMFYRTPPFGGRYVVAAGTETFVRWLEEHGFSGDDVSFLSTVAGKDGQPLFTDDYLEFLTKWRFRGSIEAVPEGTVIFPHEPIIRVRAPLFDAQIIETTLLAVVNYQSLIATKASRVRLAAGTDEVLEFGLRRAHGLDGGLSASRAAFIGGVDATSNVLAAARFGLPVRGTHAHSWVMAFNSEPEAFAAYTDVFPHNSVLLIDTYDTLEGVKNAIEAGLQLRQQGADLMGVRLDSGDLAYLSAQTRQMLDAHGFHETKIVASNDLDERLITSLKSQGAPIDSWGIGTKLVTGCDDPALGGVYKLAAVENESGEMIERMKLSEQSAKTSIPGCLEVARLKEGTQYVGDVIFDTLTEIPPSSQDKMLTIISPVDPWKRKMVAMRGLEISLLLKPVFKDGLKLDVSENVTSMRNRTLDNLAAFDRAIFRLDNPHAYAAGISQKLHERREVMRAMEFEKIKQRIAQHHDNGINNGPAKD